MKDPNSGRPSDEGSEPTRPIARFNLTEAQTDGRACVICGAEGGPVEVPATGGGAEDRTRRPDLSVETGISEWVVGLLDYHSEADCA